MGSRVHLSGNEDGGLKDKLDRLASLLRQHWPGRLAAFWEAIADDESQATPPTNMLETAIRDRIRSLNLTPYRVAKMTKVDASVIQRFMASERSLTLATAKKLAKALDMVLIIRPGSTLSLDLVRAHEEARERREGND